MVTVLSKIHSDKLRDKNKGEMLLHVDKNKGELLLHVVSSWLTNVTGERYVSKLQNSFSVENSPIHKKCPKTAQNAVDACSCSCGEKLLCALNHSVIVSDTSPVDNPFKRVTGENLCPEKLELELDTNMYFSV